MILEYFSDILKVEGPGTREPPRPAIEMFVVKRRQKGNADELANYVFSYAFRVGEL